MYVVSQIIFKRFLSCTEELRPWRPKVILCNDRSRLLAVRLLSSNPSTSYPSQPDCKQRHNETARNLWLGSSFSQQPSMVGVNARLLCC